MDLGFPQSNPPPNNAPNNVSHHVVANGNSSVAGNPSRIVGTNNLVGGQGVGQVVQTNQYYSSNSNQQHQQTGSFVQQQQQQQHHRRQQYQSNQQQSHQPQQVVQVQQQQQQQQQHTVYAVPNPLGGGAGAQSPRTSSNIGSTALQYPQQVLQQQQQRYQLPQQQPQQVVQVPQAQTISYTGDQRQQQQQISMSQSNHASQHQQLQLQRKQQRQQQSSSSSGGIQYHSSRQSQHQQQQNRTQYQQQPSQQQQQNRTQYQQQQQAQQQQQNRTQYQQQQQAQQQQQNRTQYQQQQTQQQQQQQNRTQYQQQQTQQQQQQQNRTQYQQQQTQQQQSRRSKVVLSKQAKHALAKAIWSAIRSPVGDIAPDLMQAALNTGLPKHAILNAARVAREREAAKRKALQYKQQKNKQHQQMQQYQHSQSQSQSLQSQHHIQQPQQQRHQQQQMQMSQQMQHQPSGLGPQSSMLHQQLSPTRGNNQHQQNQQHHMPSQHQRGQLPVVGNLNTNMNNTQHHYHNQPQSSVQYSTNRNNNNQLQQQQLHQRQQLQQQQLKQRQLELQKQQFNHQQQQFQLKKEKLQKQQQLQLHQQQLQMQIQMQKHQKLKQQQRAQVMNMNLNSYGHNAGNSIGKNLASIARAKQATVVSAQQVMAAKALKLKMEERSKWRRVFHGIFMVQKGKFVAPPNTVSGFVRSNSKVPLLTVRRETKVSSSILCDAASIQQLLKLQSQIASHPSSTTSSIISTMTNNISDTPLPLLDAERFKRIKMEPKKIGKALDRNVRASRKSAADALNKQHKELSKAISSHQQEFFRFHKQMKTEAAKLARAIRDNANKELKRKEKDGVAAEKARLAALKANDMDAYSKLLEETKNERLKFLMDKTENHFSQISTSLLQTRNNDKNVTSNGGAASYYASAHLKTEDIQQPSILVGGDLKEYQLAGLQWMVSLYNNKLNGILADEMGLGKTIQAISLISYLMEYKNNLGPYLVIVPLSTLSNWVNEFQKWLPSAHLICYKGIPAQRKEIYREKVKNGHFNVLLTTYEYIIKDKASLRKITWQYAIVDEGHRMKNAASKFAKTLSSQYETKYRLLLTGTPLMNDLSELWSLLNFLLPSIFNSVDTFDQWFNRPFAQFGNSNKDDDAENSALTNEERMFIIHRLHELLRPFMLRRVKSEVLDQLPEKVEKILRCELSSWQKELYKQISKKAVAENELGNTNSGPQGRGLNNAVMQLRKVCNHPYLFSPQGYHINQNIIRSSTKVELLDRMLPKLRAAGHRVLLFTQMTAVMTILEDYFAYRQYLSLRLDGSTPAEEREKRMYKFNAPDSPYFIFLLSTRAGGLGLNLTAANTVIIFDSDWNPMMDLQAQDRAHRIGQRSDVSVFRMVTRSPVEEKILSRATEKLNMSELVVEAGKFDKTSVENDNSLERKRMMEVLLVDFDTNANKNDSDTTKIGNQPLEEKGAEFTGSEDGEIDDGDDDDDDNNSEASKEDDLNGLLSNNENDYQLYKSLDKMKATRNAIDTTLFTSQEDIPDWIKYPSGNKDTGPQDTGVPGSGPRKRKEVMYDDGLTEKQFLKMMDKQFDRDAAAKMEQKALKRNAKSLGASAPIGAPVSVAVANSELTDWTFRKLISCAKSVVALKEPSTKRRLCEIFMDKPSPEQFPDYYEIIQKPIAINDILRKCRGKMYANMQEFHDDWKLMFANAKQFNGDDSWVVEDGKTIKKELDRVLKKNGFIDEAGVKPKPPPKAKKKLRIKLSLKTLKTKDNSAEGNQGEVDGTSTEPVKKKRKKNKTDTVL